jgi:hypothetical protein
VVGKVSLRINKMDEVNLVSFLIPSTSKVSNYQSLPFKLTNPNFNN